MPGTTALRSLNLDYLELCVILSQHNRRHSVKTIYTDRYGLYPWIWGIFGLLGLPYVFGYLVDGRYIMASWSMIASVGPLYLAYDRVRDVRRARREGRDPSIMRITDTAS